MGLQCPETTRHAQHWFESGGTRQTTSGSQPEQSCIRSGEQFAFVAHDLVDQPAFQPEPCVVDTDGSEEIYSTDPICCCEPETALSSLEHRVDSTGGQADRLVHQISKTTV